MVQPSFRRWPSETVSVITLDCFKIQGISQTTNDVPTDDKVNPTDDMVTSIIRGVCNDIRKEFDNDLDATPQIMISNLKEALDDYNSKQEKCMRNLLYIYEQYPGSDSIDVMKNKFVKINEKATCFLYKNLVRGLLNETKTSSGDLEPFNGKFKKQSTILWDIVNSEQHDDNMVFFKWKSVFACKIDFMSLNLERWMNQVFVENIEDTMRLYDVRLEDLSMIFFPMIASNHHYVVVYDLRSPSMEILDNRRSDRTLLQLYGDQIDVLHKHFTMFLNKKKASKSIDYFSIVPERLEMEWQTVYNDVDCGVFVMHHMGTYFGGGTSSWDAKIKKESYEQVMQLNDLRQDMLHTILTSNNNEKSRELHELCVTFHGGNF
uniref:Ubiquitin-like protease family profile domain-containing protein n=1 Tax=Daucus carota subsp. sativus TaxID=79200 RepID=A0A164Y8A6_DAUCS